ncbi:hypothetical protein [Chondrinema litorale]|uniref:hypothetical protein n=1 Tax=Chondrinema litorale TaxID=2994555 RepID=UPI0025427B78|nr:hypothetical protein [Chondrinema litorale]UZR97662.1 hypothetical protein OQ292_28055 [Chondrinema litorale]
MRILFRTILIISLGILAIAACQPNTNRPVEEVVNEDEFITGKVKEVKNGKDGYTAKLLTNSDEVYYATISIPNLHENAYQYKILEVGDKVSVKGEIWENGGQKYITVRELK